MPCQPRTLGWHVRQTHVFWVTVALLWLCALSCEGLNFRSARAAIQARVRRRDMYSNALICACALRLHWRSPDNVNNAVQTRRRVSELARKLCQRVSMTTMRWTAIQYHGPGLWLLYPQRAFKTSSKAAKTSEAGRRSTRGRRNQA
jgi:hypothetical protein